MFLTREGFERRYLSKNPVDGTNTTLPIFTNLDELELERLICYRNLIVASFNVFSAIGNEVLSLKISAALERSGRKYQISASGQMMSTTRRRLIYRYEARLWLSNTNKKPELEKMS